MNPGIVRCDMIAESIIQAASTLGGFNVPVVVRLQGTTCEEAMKMVSHNNFPKQELSSDIWIIALSVGVGHQHGYGSREGS